MTVEQRLSQLEDAFIDLQKEFNELRKQVGIKKEPKKLEPKPTVEEKEKTSIGEYNNNDAYSNEYFKAFGFRPSGF